MPSESDASTARFEPLRGAQNFLSWTDNVTAVLKEKKVWRIVNGTRTRPATDAEKQEEWDEAFDSAGGILWLRIDQSLHSSLRHLRDNPISLWAELSQRYHQNEAQSRFTALDKLLSVRKRDDEGLEGVGMRVQGLAAELRALQPATNYNLASFNSELEAWAMIRALAYTEHESLIQTITLTGTTGPNYVMDAFRQADGFKQGRASDDPTSIQALL